MYTVEYKSEFEHILTYYEDNRKLIQNNYSHINNERSKIFKVTLTKF